MTADEIENLSQTGEMRKRRVLMADERRYLIYYTFGDESKSLETEDARNVSEAIESKSEEARNV